MSKDEIGSSSPGDCVCKYDDINDAFESITFLEDNLNSKGFEEGFVKGQVLGETDGYHLGYHRGAEIGAELGYYKGFFEVLKKTFDSGSLVHLSELLEKLSKLIDSYPKVNDESTDLIDLRDSIRSTYKRLCSLLKLDPKIPENSQLSF